MPSCLKACDFTQINGKWTAFIWHYPSLINHSKRFALHATFAHTHTLTQFILSHIWLDLKRLYEIQYLAQGHFDMRGGSQTL